MESALCYVNEVDECQDPEVRRLLALPTTGRRLLSAARRVQAGTGSALLKLSLEALPAEPIDSIGELEEAVRAACSFPLLPSILECAALAGAPVMLRAQAPFSALMLRVNSRRMFSWLCRYPASMQAALERIAERTAGALQEALDSGIAIVSLADPSAMPELLGEERYMRFAADMLVRELHRLEPPRGALVHLCPRASRALEERGCLSARVIEARPGNYPLAALGMAQREGVTLLGHRCVNCEWSSDTRMYALRLTK